MFSLSLAVKELIKDLSELGIKYAFVGALALGARGRTRQTIDADIAISLSTGYSAQSLVDQLVLKGYGINNIYQDKNRIVLARLFAANQESQLVELDFLFELCGIENEVVTTAEVMEIWPTLFAPIASMPSLLAMKARCQELPERIQDKADLVNQLVPYATEKDISEARELIRLMEQRGFNEGRDLLKSFDYLVQTSLIRK